MDELIQKHTRELQDQKSNLQSLMSNLRNELSGGLQQIAAEVKQIKSSGGSRFNKKQHAALEGLAKTVRRLSRRVRALPQAAANTQAGMKASV